MPTQPGSPTFHGWKIVLVSFLALFVSVGFGFYSFGAFFVALTEEFGGGRTGVGVGLALFGITNGLVAPFLGSALDRGHAKRIMLWGAWLLALGLLLTAAVRNLIQFYLVLGTLLSLGAALIGGVTASTLVANWYVRKRAMALGIATMGISLSGVVMAPVATRLIAVVGWRGTFVIYGALTLLFVVPAVRRWVIDRPEDIGLHPDGDVTSPVAGWAPAPIASSPPRPPLWTEPLRSRNFWVIALVVSMNFCANSAILTHIIAHARDLGFPPLPASYGLSTIAAMGVLGKVVFGWIGDRLSGRGALWLAIGLQASGSTGLLQAESYTALLSAAAVFGLGMGGMMPLWGTLIGACFGRRSFGRVMGLMSPILLPIQILGVPFAGYVFDRSGTYDLAFAVFVCMYLSAMLVLFLLRTPAQEPAEAPAPAGLETAANP
ncbi:MAG: MFS transporter [Acidobacteria bacterium]|nr:MFS transporter [Acidobacteriota bacterium]